MKYSSTRLSDEIRTTTINIRLRAADGTRTAQHNVMLTPTELGELHAVGRELELDQSNTLRFLVRQKARALEVTSSSELDEFRAVARELSLDVSSMLRFLVREKARALGLVGCPGRAASGS